MSGRNHVRKGRAAKRQAEAAERQTIYDSLSDKDKLNHAARIKASWKRNQTQKSKEKA